MGHVSGGTGGGRSGTLALNIAVERSGLALRVGWMAGNGVRSIYLYIYYIESSNKCTEAKSLLPLIYIFSVIILLQEVEVVNCHTMTVSTMTRQFMKLAIDDK